jgi:hypothetical protein
MLAYIIAGLGGLILGLGMPSRSGVHGEWAEQIMIFGFVFVGSYVVSAISNGMKR